MQLCMLLPWDYIYVASREAQIENYIVDNFVYGYKMTMCAISNSTKKMHLRGGRGSDPCLLTKQVWEGRYSKDNFCQIKKKTMIKIILKCGELFSGLIFQQIYYSIKAISLPLLDYLAGILAKLRPHILILWSK